MNFGNVMQLTFSQKFEIFKKFLENIEVLENKYKK